MPYLGIAKQRIADQIGSAATKGEGRQNMLCAYLAGALLVGLLANAAFGAWWLDPLDRPADRRRRGQGGPGGLARRRLRLHVRPTRGRTQRVRGVSESQGATEAEATLEAKTFRVSSVHFPSWPLVLASACGSRRLRRPADAAVRTLPFGDRVWALPLLGLWQP